MGAELIINFDRDLFHLSHVFRQQPESMDSLMSQLILLLHGILILNLDNATLTTLA